MGTCCGASNEEEIDLTKLDLRQRKLIQYKRRIQDNEPEEVTLQI